MQLGVIDQQQSPLFIRGVQDMTFKRIVVGGGESDEGSEARSEVCH